MVKGIDRKLQKVVEYCKRICAMLLYTHVNAVTAREKCHIPSQSLSRIYCKTLWGVNKLCHYITMSSTPTGTSQFVCHQASQYLLKVPYIAFENLV